VSDGLDVDRRRALPLAVFRMPMKLTKMLTMPRLLPFLALALLGGQFAWGQQDAGCLSCHPSPGLFSRLAKGEKTTPGAELSRFKGDAHKSLNCTACHPGTNLGHHPTKPVSLQCEQCHVSGGVQGARPMPLIDLLHARGTDGTPTCNSCHGHHGVARANAPGARTARENAAKLCGTCHADPSHGSTTPQVTDYNSSVHAAAVKGSAGPAATCVDCHAVHATSKGSGAMLLAARVREPRTCGRCHAEPANSYSHSVHGVQLMTRPDAMPVCTDCHGTHNIQRVADPRSPASHERVVATCDRCHGNADFANANGLTTIASQTYDESYHGKAHRYGNKRAPTCNSCHSAHGILPASSVSSPTNIKNVPRTCAQCHPGAETSPQIGLFHVLPIPSLSWLLFLIRAVYMLLVFGSFAGFVAYIVFDLAAHRRLVKAGVEERFEHQLSHLPRPAENALIRMFPIERLQHFLLLISFITLAITGMALLIPDTVVGRFIILLCGGMSGRAVVHRVSAGIMVSNFLFQAIWLASTKRGRQNVRDLAPGFSDLRDLYQTVLLFLGFSRNRPSFGRYGFAEKFEFWALVWGTLVMTLTGLLLAYVGWTLGHAPKWVVDASELIHKWEAILAVGAIGIWHIYHVVWKPGVYPGNRAWLTGEISFEQLVMEHPLEYARAMGWLPRPETQTEASPETPAEPPSNKEGDVD
jgi:cytochrome b subunit of formate dehydrogenase